MRAVVGKTIVAEATQEEVVTVEQNSYFPPYSLMAGVLRDSPFPYICSWKGRAQYYDIVVGETVLRDAAWSYPSLEASATARVGQDFSGYVAFDARQIRIEN